MKQKLTKRELLLIRAIREYKKAFSYAWYDSFLYIPFSLICFFDGFFSLPELIHWFQKRTLSLFKQFSFIHSDNFVGPE